MSYTPNIMKLISNPDEFFAEMKSHELKISKPRFNCAALGNVGSSKPVYNHNQAF